MSKYEIISDKERIFRNTKKRFAIRKKVLNQFFDMQKEKHPNFKKIKIFAEKYLALRQLENDLFPIDEDKKTKAF